MKPKSITLGQGQYDHALEELLVKKHSHYLEHARKHGKHHGKLNKPNPAGDKLMPFVSDIKAGYEELGATVFHMLQPQTHFPEAKMDSDFVKEKEKQLDMQITELNNQNNQSEYELHHFNPGSIPARALIALLLTLIILIGEVFYNVKAFQVIVENMLFALGLSISISISVVVASHITAFFYKAAKTKYRRWTVVVLSLLVMSIVFYAIALIRSTYLERHNTHINPCYFITFNLFFFIISAFISFFTLPTWEEFKEQYIKYRIYKAVRKRKREVKKLADRKMLLKAHKNETEKERARIIYYSQYLSERIRKMYSEAIGTFKGTNLIYRSDQRTPDCFNDLHDELNLQDISIPINSQREINK